MPAADRIRLGTPDPVIFTTTMGVRITDVNYGGHLGNDAVLGLLHEARVRWLRSLQASEADIGGVGLILRQAVIDYKAESFVGDQLEISIGVAAVQRFGFDLLYRAVRKHPEPHLETVRALTRMVGFDYRQKKLAPLPEPFRLKIAPGGE